MKVSLGTVDVSDFERRALAWRLGNPGLATREDVRFFFYGDGAGGVEVFVHDFRTYLDALAIRDSEEGYEPLSAAERRELARWGGEH